MEIGGWIAICVAAYVLFRGSSDKANSDVTVVAAKDAASSGGVTPNPPTPVAPAQQINPTSPGPLENPASNGGTGAIANPAGWAENKSGVPVSTGGENVKLPPDYVPMNQSDNVVANLTSSSNPAGGAANSTPQKDVSVMPSSSYPPRGYTVPAPPLGGPGGPPAPLPQAGYEDQIVWSAPASLPPTPKVKNGSDGAVRSLIRWG